MPAAVFITLALLGMPQSPADRREMVNGIKEIERSLGFEQPHSFQHQTEKRAASYRCYYTGPLTLPASYEELELRQESEAGCRIDPARYDVFFYAIEAVAGGKQAVTSSLAESSVERFTVVVTHEDFHDDKAIRKLPDRFGEAAATLVGFLTAAEFSRTQFGADSAEYRNLAGEADLFLKKAALVNAWHARLSKLYERHRAGDPSADEALKEKGRAFAELDRACKAILPEPRSFNKCPGANNNAGLAFDATYARFYPLLYELWGALGRDLKATVEALQQAPPSRSEERTEAYFRELIARTASAR